MTIKLIRTQKVLSPTQITLADYVINPYRGCEFACLYCYSQENKNLKSPDSRNYIGVKINSAVILEKELRYITPKRVLLGSTTECFQYAELKYGITAKILEILNAAKIPCTILTKSNLIKNYLPLIASNKENKIYFTLNCAQDRIITLMEKKSPCLRNRIRAVKDIIAAGINLRIHIGPFIPCLSDWQAIFDIIPEGVKEVDIEMYHNKMGNFNEMLKLIAESMGRQTEEKLREIYSSKIHYEKFTENLKREITEKTKSKKFKLFYIVPDFEQFYSPQINYETPLF